MKYKVFFTLAIYGGMRKGEILGLEWKNIDYAHCTIDVMRASLYTPKTRGSIRTLKLPEFILDMLKEYRQWQDSQRAALEISGRITTGCLPYLMASEYDPLPPAKWLKQIQKQHNLRNVIPTTSAI